MKTILTLLVIFGFCLAAFSQEKSKREQKGDKHYFSYNFDKAIESYTEAKNLTEEGQRKLAESYAKIERNAEAEAAYAKLVGMSNGRVPEDYYNYAAVLKTNGKYDEAARWMESFGSLRPNDSRVQSFRKQKAEMNILMADKGEFQINEQRINSDDQDFGTAFYINNQVVFASTRAKPTLIKRKYAWNGKPFLDIYVSEALNGQLQNPKNFSKVLNSKLHDGPASFSKNGTFVAFTRNNLENKRKDEVVELQIHFSSFDGSKWSEPEPFAFNSPGYSVGHPVLTADGQTMYFVSDMPGGIGGTDIYRSTRIGTGSWSQPENLGAGFNTEGDEMFPFIDEENEILFFASDGHFGLGGMDIFYHPLDVPPGSEPKNLGAPVNGRFDDFAMIIDPATNKGYFSTNRNGIDNSDDIMGFNFSGSFKIMKRVEGFAMDQDRNILPDVMVSLYDGEGDLVSSMKNNEEGGYSFMLENNKNYKIVGTKEGYLDGTTPVNTFGEDSLLRADVILTIKEAPIEVNSDLTEVLNLNTIYFDFDRDEIRPDAAVELDKIVNVLNKYPNMEVRFSSHADCRGVKSYNQDLSERRARSTVEYIRARISNPERISGQGFGESKLVNDCICERGDTSGCSEAQHERNRRSEFIVTKK